MYEVFRRAWWGFKRFAYYAGLGVAFYFLAMLTWTGHVSSLEEDGISVYFCFMTGSAALLVLLKFSEPLWRHFRRFVSVRRLVLGVWCLSFVLLLLAFPAIFAGMSEEAGVVGVAGKAFSGLYIGTVAGIVFKYLPSGPLDRFRTELAKRWESIKP